MKHFLDIVENLNKYIKYFTYSVFKAHIINFHGNIEMATHFKQLEIRKK